MTLNKKISSYHGHGHPESIGLQYIASNLISNGFKINFKTKLELEVTSNYNRNVSFLSPLTFQWEEAVELAKKAKSRGNITVAGGYHVCNITDLQEIDECFDYIVHGEGEFTAIDLLNKIFKTENKEIKREIIKSEIINDLNLLPFPIRDSEIIKDYKIYDLMWPPPSHQNNTCIVLASRGCEHNCNFCASATVWGQGLRVRSHENIIGELVELKEKYSTNTIVFIDQSFGQSPEWSIDLCHKIIDTDLNINWYHQSNLDIDRYVLKSMAQAGCTKIGFGMEGISPRAIEEVKPQNPYDFDKINDLFKYCNSLGLFVKAYLMIGFPWETKEIIESYYEYIEKIGANQIKISYYTPFPGTRDWERYKDQLVTDDWSKFDTVQMPVVYNPHITVDEYDEIREKLFRKFYGSGKYSQLTSEMLSQYPHYEKSYIEFIEYLKSFNMVDDDFTIAPLKNSDYLVTSR